MKKHLLSISVIFISLAMFQISCGEGDGTGGLPGGDLPGGGSIGSGDNTVYAPRSGAAAPVLIWGNATGSSVRTYRTLHQFFADNGYLVVAANDTSTGQGETLIEALNWIEAENRNPRSPYYGKADLTRVAISGHSQGGASAVVAAGSDSRFRALASLQPDCAFWVRCNNTASVRATSLLVAGASDTLVSPRTVENVYRDMRAPVVHAEIRGMGHTGWYGDQVGSMGRQMLSFFNGVLNQDQAKLNQFRSGNCRDCGSSWQLKSKNF